MPEIFVKEFSEIATVETIKKAKVIAKQKNRDGYSPGKDFYKILREHIQAMHKDGLPLEHIDNALKATTHNVRKKHYAVMIAQYKKWLRKKNVTYFVPPREAFQISKTEIITNPELGLNIDGTPYVVKLFLNKDKLTKVRANFMIAIMDSLWSETTNAVLDVRNEKLFTFTGDRKHYLNAITAEVASIEVMWPDL